MADIVFEINPREFEQLRAKLASGELSRGPAREFVSRSAQFLRGEIVKRFVGNPDFAELHTLIDKLLLES